MLQLFKDLVSNLEAQVEFPGLWISGDALLELYVPNKVFINELVIKADPKLEVLPLIEKYLLEEAKIDYKLYWSTFGSYYFAGDKFHITVLYNTDETYNYNKNKDFPAWVLSRVAYIQEYMQNASIASLQLISLKTLYLLIQSDYLLYSTEFSRCHKVFREFKSLILDHLPDDVWHALAASLGISEDIIRKTFYDFVTPWLDYEYSYGRVWDTKLHNWKIVKPDTIAVDF